MSPVTPLRGRGAVSNASGRYEANRAEAFDDGWGDDGWDGDGWGEEDAKPRRLDTTLTAEAARTILTRNDSPDIGFDRSINPYRGCEHGCIYCYARPAHAYMDLSPGIDFESKLFFKPNAAELLERELSKPGYAPQKLHIGANTDPYQPVERRLEITRSVIAVLARFGHPFSIITKSALIVRDLDLIAPMAAQGLAKAYVSVTTLDRALARAMEPRAATPDRRLSAIKALSGAGVPTGIGFSPVIPGLNDHEMEAVLERGAAAGATESMFIVLRLPLEIKDLFREWLEAERPDRAARVMSLVRQMRGGRDYDPQWGSRMTGQGPLAELYARRFKLATAKHGLNRTRATLRTDLFRVPPRAGDQIELFG